MARDYAKISARFWTGPTGKQLRKNRNAQVLAAYVISSPGSTMTGIYYLPLPNISHETGIPEAEVLEALEFLGTLDFAHYDQEEELVWVPAMAEWQVADELQPNDNRVKGIKRELANFRGHRFVNQFWTRYGSPFHLGKRPSEAPLKPLRSQEQDQDQEQEQEQDQEKEQKECLSPAIPPAPPVAVPPATVPTAFRSAAAPYPVGAITEPFLAVFNRYVNQSGRVKAAATWQETAAGFPGGEAALAKVIGAAFGAGLLKQHPFTAEHRYQPTFEQFLALRRWEDPIVVPTSAAARASPSAKNHLTGHVRAEDMKHTTTGEYKA